MDEMERARHEAVIGMVARIRAGEVESAHMARVTLNSGTFGLTDEEQRMLAEAIDQP
jgi:hypothetical protein